MPEKDLIESVEDEMLYITREEGLLVVAKSKNIDFSINLIKINMNNFFYNLYVISSYIILILLSIQLSLNLHLISIHLIYNML